MKPLITFLCLAAIAGCGDHIQKIEAQKLQIELLTKDRDYWRTYAESLEKGNSTAAVSHDFETSTSQANITREQLAGIYRRLVELEKRAGIRDAEGEKVEASNILIGDTTTNPKSLQEIDREYRESQESPHHEQ